MNNGLHWREIEKLREKVHTHANMITELNTEIEGVPERVAALETLVNKFLGMVIVIAFLSGSFGAMLLQIFKKG